MRGTVYSAAPENNASSCVYIRSHINALLLLEFCSRDATMVRITYTYGRGCEELIVASAYFPYDLDEQPPTKEMRGTSLTTAKAGKSNSSSGTMPTHTAYCGGAPAPTREEKASWNFW
jgi:hypothetical protein